MRILLVEDNRPLAEWLTRFLCKERFVVDFVLTGQEAEAALRAQKFDFVILDLALPDINGDELLRQFRQRDATTPVLILTANDAVSSRVAQLDAGADDYLIKPFDVKELAARIRVLLRRRRNDYRPQLICGDLSFDGNTRSFLLAGEPLDLTRREHAVLEALMLNAGRTVSKASLADTVAGFSESGSPNSIEVYVHRVRRKLEGHNLAIVTLRGIGYVLRTPK